MRSMFCKSGLVALIVGLALGVSPATAGTVTLNNLTGQTTGPNQHLYYTSATLHDVANIAPDGTYAVSNGLILIGASPNFPSPITISGNGPSPYTSFTANGTINDVQFTGSSSNSVSGIGSITFTNPNLAQQFQSYYYNVDFNDAGRVTSGSLILSTAAVPEPSAFAMGATALVGLIAARRRLAKSAA